MCALRSKTAALTHKNVYHHIVLRKEHHMKIGNVFKSLLAGGMLFTAMSGFVSANPSLTTNVDNSGLCLVSLTHDYTNSRYCELSIKSGSSFQSSTTVGFASGVLSPGVVMNMERQVTGRKGIGVAIVYFGQSPYTASVWSDVQEVNNPSY